MTTLVDRPSIARRAQAAAFNAVAAAVAEDRVAHAWLLYGPEGVGQRDVAIALSQALNCEQAAAGAGCGSCSTCDRIAVGTHPGLVAFTPEGREHRVTDVREQWLPVAMRSPAEGRRQVLHVENADRMNESAQNAFLKALEEPGPSTVWVLDVADDSQLLDTISSRCMELRVTPWATDDLVAFGKATRSEIDDVELQSLARLALGSPSQMEALLHPDVREARRTLTGVFGDLAARGPGAALSFGEHFAGLAHAREAAVIEDNERIFAELEEQFGGASARGRGWPPGERSRVQQLHKRQAREANTSAMQLALRLHASMMRDILVCVTRPDVGQALQTDGRHPAITNLDQRDQILTAARTVPAQACIEIMELCDEGEERIARNVNQKAIVRDILVRTAMGMAGA